MPGVDRQRVGEVLVRASGASLILERKLSALVAYDYRAGFGRLDSSGLLNLLEPSPGLGSPGGCRTLRFSGPGGSRSRSATADRQL